MIAFHPIRLERLPRQDHLFSLWRASAPRPPEADRYLLHDLGPGGRTAVVPISDDEVYLWRLHRDDGSPRPPAAERLDRFRETLAPFGGVIPIVVERIRPERIDYRPLQALLVPPPWFRGRVVLVGDAAHTTTPHIAYGAGIAIQDSVVRRGGRPGRRRRRGAPRRSCGGGSTAPSSSS